MKTILVSIVAAGALALAVGLHSASAAPATEEVIVTCGSDTFEVNANGGGKFGTARVIETGQIFVVTAFSNVSGSFTTNDGQVFQFEDPDVSHPAPPNRELIDCSFVVTFENKFGEGQASGDVTGFYAGRPD